jgi:hypothetical protein
VAPENNAGGARMIPRWLERALIVCLSPRDRETVSGDLREEYLEDRLPRLGRFRADLWYLRQIAGIATVKGTTTMKQLLIMTSLFVTAASVWLIVMENILRHTGYGGRAAVDACLALQALGTLLFLRLHVYRTLLLASAAAVGAYGAWAVIGILNAGHFEAFVLIIGTALVVHAALTFLILMRKPEWQS